MAWIIFQNTGLHKWLVRKIGMCSSQEFQGRCDCCTHPLLRSDPFLYCTKLCLRRDSGNGAKASTHEPFAHLYIKCIFIFCLLRAALWLSEQALKWLYKLIEMLLSLPLAHSCLGQKAILRKTHFYNLYQHIKSVGRTRSTEWPSLAQAATYLVSESSCSSSCAIFASRAVMEDLYLDFTALSISCSLARSSLFWRSSCWRAFSFFWALLRSAFKSVFIWSICGQEQENLWGYTHIQTT